MPRPKSEDPAIAVTLRVRRSVLERYQAQGAGWRLQMHAALEEGISGAVSKPAVSEPKPKPQKEKEVVVKVAEKPAGRLVGFTTSGEPIYRK